MLRFPALLLASAVAITACDAGSAEPGTKSPAETSGKVSLHFADPTLAKAPADRCDGPLCRPLLAAIEGATRRIDFALYGLRGQSAIMDALTAARARGVKVRGVVDRDAEGKNYYKDTDELVSRLELVRDDGAWEKQAARNADGDSFGTPNCPRPEGFEGPLQCLAYDLGNMCLLAAHASREDLEGEGAIMHDKFFVVDDKWVFTGSANASDSGIGGYNANVVAIIESSLVANYYGEEFDQMYFDGRYHGAKKSSGVKKLKVGKTEIEVMFSPQDKPMTNGVRPVLQAAKSRIDIAVFFLTHKHVVQDLIEAKQRGVKIRVIMDATGAKNGYTKHELLRAAGIPVKVEDWGGKMHMKSAVIDGETVIVGSMNWTSAGEGGNDENTVILKDKGLALQYATFYDRLWDSIDDRWLTANPDPESKDSGTACTDGSDNDFDGLKDADDPGCSDNPPAMPALPPWQIIPKGDRSVCDWAMVAPPSK